MSKCQIKACDTVLNADDFLYCPPCLKRRDDLIIQYTALVYKLANDEWYGGMGKRLGELADCVQVAFLGLMRTIDCYNPNITYMNKDSGKQTSVGFSTYAHISIRRFIRLYCYGNGVIHIPRAAFIKNLRDGLDDDVTKACNLWEGCDFRKHSELVDKRWDRSVEDDDFYEYLENGIHNCLEEGRDLTIFNDRIKKGIPLRELRETFNISHERIRQICSTAIKKLRKVFKPDYVKLKRKSKKEKPKPKRKMSACLGVDVSKIVNDCF